VRTVVDFLFNALKIGIDNAINNFRTMLNIVKAVFNGIGSAWNNTFGQISFDIPNIPGLPGRGTKIQFPKIPALAEGGVVTGPTLALIGEAGPEAVIPLDRMGSMGGGNVTINVNGGDPQAVVDALRKFYRQNGPIPVGVSY
jgi:phage-related minor tail protein